MAKNFKIDKAEGKKIAKGAIISFLGAGLIALLNYVGNFDFGTAEIVITALSSSAVNAIRVWMQDNGVDK